MPDSLAGVVLAAGAGTRLRPLSIERPKPLCPVANVALVDWALARVRSVAGSVAVNVHHGRTAMEHHLGALDGPSGPAGPVHMSVEEPRALGTAGALGQLRDWIDGRPVLLTNGDAWLPVEPAVVTDFVDGWDGERVRLLCVVDASWGDFGSLRYVGLAAMPWAEVARLGPEPSGLYETSWRRARDDDRLDLVVHDGPFGDCGNPVEYLEANLRAVGDGTLVGDGATVAGHAERSVIGPGAVVAGEVVRSVVWPGATVTPSERLVDAVRGRRFSVLVR